MLYSESITLETEFEIQMFSSTPARQDSLNLYTVRKHNSNNYVLPHRTYFPPG